MDRALVAAGFPPTSPWWRKQLERFARAARRRWIVRAGRRAGKSSTLCRLAVAWALWGAWSVPAGDVAIVPFVSVSKDEASARLRTIGAILRALKIAFSERSDEIELLLPGKGALLFRAIACTTTATVGFTSVAVFGDEVARWESRDTGANPAKEVIASLAPTMATQPAAFMVLSSSPWSVDDFHAESFDAGDTATQIVSFAPTWIANPTITEQQTHELEPDERIWSREYAAEPGATLSDALDAQDVAACFDRWPAGKPAHGFLAIDASSLRGDAFTWMGGRVSTAGEVTVQATGGWSGNDLRHVSMAYIVRDIARHALGTYGTRTIFGDQREEAALRALFLQQKVNLRSYAWSEVSKDEAVMLLRRLMRERKVLLPDHSELKRELTSMKARLMPSGRTRYETNGLDYASALITLCHAIVARDLFLSGVRRSQGGAYFNRDGGNYRMI
jgi:hypothetical protein